MLGVKFTGDGKPPKDHIEWMAEKGKTWTNNLKTKGFVTARDGWKSLNTQLKPKLEFGLVAVCANPATLESIMSTIQCDALSAMGVNKNIHKELRTAHARYQGMGMFDLNDSCMEFKIHLMREYWNRHDSLGTMMKVAYETFQVDVGLGGNVFSRDYERLCKLAQPCWFEHLWHLCDFLKVDVELHESHNVQPIRENDKCFMDAAVETGLFDITELVSLGVCRKYKGVHMLSCLVTCDGREVRKDMLDDGDVPSARHFPHERPTPTMLEQWNRAIETIASEKRNGKMCLPNPLGKFLLPSLRQDGWYASQDETTLYHDQNQNEYVVFVRLERHERRMLRSHNNIFREFETKEGKHLGQKYATVTELANGDVQLHSSATIPETVVPRKSFIEALKSLPNQSLWDDTSIDGDGEWICDGLTKGSLIMVHDGSYNEDLDPDKCSAAYIIMCRRTKYRMQGTVVDKCERASNDRA